MKALLLKLIHDRTPRRVDTRSLFIGVFAGISASCVRFAVTDDRWYLWLSAAFYLAIARGIHVHCPPKDAP